MIHATKISKLRFREKLLSETTLLIIKQPSRKNDDDHSTRDKWKNSSWEIMIRREDYN